MIRYQGLKDPNVWKSTNINWIASARLQKVVIEDDSRRLWCHTNELKEIDLPISMVSINCSRNLIKDISINENLIYCRSDNIKLKGKSIRSNFHQTFVC